MNLLLRVFGFLVILGIGVVLISASHQQALSDAVNQPISPNSTYNENASDNDQVAPGEVALYQHACDMDMQNPANQNIAYGLNKTPDQVCSCVVNFAPSNDDTGDGSQYDQSNYYHALQVCLSNNPL